MGGGGEGRRCERVRFYGRVSGWGKGGDEAIAKGGRDRVGSGDINGGEGKGAAGGGKLRSLLLLLPHPATPGEPDNAAAATP